MEAYLQLKILIPVAVFLISGLLLYLNGRRKKSRKDKTGGKEGKMAPCRIYDYNKNGVRRVYDELVSVSKLEEVNEKFKYTPQVMNYEGKYITEYWKTTKGDYVPVVNPDTVDGAAINLYNNLRLPGLALRVLMEGLKEEKAFFQKYGYILIWTGVIAFLILMVVKG